MSEHKKSLFEQLLKLNEFINEQIPFWNQGQGGNISVKFDHSSKMAIKPTGYRLDQLQSEKDFAYLDLKNFKKDLEDLSAKPISTDEKEFFYSEAIKTHKQFDLRASMEAGFHAFLKSQFVLHFHCLDCVLFADLFKVHVSEYFLRKWQDYYEIIPYVRPGWQLSNYFIQNKISKKLVIIENHGVILQLDDPREFAKFKLFMQDVQEILSAEIPVNFKDLKTEILAGRQLVSPLAYYYPDVAILEEKLRACLVASGDQTFKFDMTKKDSHKDLYENWQAMVYLSQAQPLMMKMPASEAESLKKLPTELARMQQMNSGKTL